MVVVGGGGGVVMAAVVVVTVSGLGGKCAGVSPGRTAAIAPVGYYKVFRSVNDLPPGRLEGGRADKTSINCKNLAILCTETKKKKKGERRGKKLKSIEQTRIEQGPRKNPETQSQSRENKTSRRVVAGRRQACRRSHAHMNRTIGNGPLGCAVRYNTTCGSTPTG